MKPIDAIKRLDENGQSNGKVYCPDLLGLVVRGLISVREDPSYFRSKAQEGLMMNRYEMEAGALDQLAQDPTSEITPELTDRYNGVSQGESIIRARMGNGPCGSTPVLGQPTLDDALEEAEQSSGSYGLRRAAVIALRAGSEQLSEMYLFLAGQARNRELAESDVYC